MLAVYNYEVIVAHTVYMPCSLPLVLSKQLWRWLLQQGMLHLSRRTWLALLCLNTVAIVPIRIQIIFLVPKLNIFVVAALLVQWLLYLWAMHLNDLGMLLYGRFQRLVLLLLSLPTVNTSRFVCTTRLPWHQLPARVSQLRPTSLVCLWFILLGFRDSSQCINFFLRLGVWVIVHLGYPSQNFILLLI